MDCVAIIPARLGSTRFPGKLLATLAGRPLIQHVVEGVLRIPGIATTVVATDDERIAEAARAAGVEVFLSLDEFASGTDRVAAAAERFPAAIVVNVQGDELLMEPTGVAAALESFRSSEVDLGTLRAPLREAHDLYDPNVVKVVVDDAGRALYFSRAPVPFPRPGPTDVTAGNDPSGAVTASHRGDGAAGGVLRSVSWMHIGVYFYRRQALRQWAARPPSALELAEGLEQLRVVEAGERMQTYLIRDAVPGVNTPDDLERLRGVLASRTTHA